MKYHVKEGWREPALTDGRAYFEKAIINMIIN